jgi:hypothetical protein
MESMSALAQGHKQIYRRCGLNPRDAVLRSRGQSFAAALEIDLGIRIVNSTLRAYLHMVQPTEYHDGGMVSKVPMLLWGHAALDNQEEPHMTSSAPRSAARFECYCALSWNVTSVREVETGLIIGSSRQQCTFNTSM